MKTLAQLLIRRALPFWTVILVLFVVGAWLRINSIDRGTPSLGVAVYLTMLMIFFAIFAVPTGMVSGALARRLLRWSVTPLQLRIASALLVALVVFAAHNLGRTLPPWHVWATSAAITALFTLRTFRWGRMFVIAWNADRATVRVAKERQALAFDLRNFQRRSR
jgi:hypothetical protein